MTRRWTVAGGVTALFGAVACGSFGTDGASPGQGTSASSSSSSGGAGPDGGGFDVSACADKDLARDPDNCGACGRSCLGASCVTGICAPVAVAEGLASPGYVRAFADDLFVVVSDGVVRLPKTGGASVRVLADLSSPLGIAVDDQRVYCASKTGGRGVVANARGAADAASSQTLKAEPMSEVAASNGELFTCLHADAAAKEDMWRFPAGGAAPVKVAKDIEDCESIATYGADVVFGGDAVFRIAASKKDEEATEIADVPARRLAVRGDWVYVVAADEKGVLRRSLTGPAIVPVANGSEPAGEGDIAVDDTHVYWNTGTADAPGKVYRARIDGQGAPGEVIATEVVPGGVALDDVAVYWTDRRSGRVFKRAK